MNEIEFMWGIAIVFLIADCFVFAFDRYEQQLEKRDEKRIELLSKLFTAMRQNPTRGTV